MCGEFAYLYVTFDVPVQQTTTEGIMYCGNTVFELAICSFCYMVHEVLYKKIVREPLKTEDASLDLLYWGCLKASGPGLWLVPSISKIDIIHGAIS